MKKIFYIFKILLTSILSLTVYLFLHELGHLIFAFSFGGQFVNFSLFPFPYVMFISNIVNPLHIAIISISGLILPFVFALFLYLFPKKNTLYRLWLIQYNFIIALSFIISFFTALMNKLELLLYDDVVIFINTTSCSPWLLAFIFLTLSISPILLISHLSIKKTYIALATHSI